MSCLACANKKTFELNSLDCFGRALGDIQHHYNYLQKSLFEQNKENNVLRQKNQQLNKAIILVEHELKVLKNEKTQNRDAKRKRKNVSLVNDNENYTSHDGSSFSENSVSVVNDSINESEEDSNLNIALNSEQLLDTSCANNSIISPSPAFKRSAKTNDNSGHSNKIQFTYDNNNEMSNDKAVRIKKPYLSLRKPPGNISGAKLKETDLEDSENLPQTDDVIGKHLKTNILKKKEANLQYQKNRQCSNWDGVTEELDGYDEDLIFSKMSSIAKSVNITNTVLDEFELRPKEKLNLSDNADETLLRDDSASVVILTPATQDIVFLNDTCDNTNINSMDFLQVLMQSNKSNNMENLKRIENERIKKLQLEATKSLSSGEVKSSQQFMIQNSSTKKQRESNSTFSGSKIKQEKLTHTGKLEEPTASEEIEDYFDVRPIKIKMETTSNMEHCLHNIDIRERYNVDCRECQQLINFMAGRLSEKEILSKLQACRLHNVESLDETPDGFWNPLMESYASNDPRNEILIDTRFPRSK